MKFKINTLIITVVLTIIVFGISTYMQKKLINYEATISCLILSEDIYENELVSKDKFKLANIPISVVATQKIVTDFSEIENLYAKDNIKKGQIAVRSQFDTKENLSIYEAEIGKEKISIKVKSAENGVSYKIKENSHINVYATLRNELATNFLMQNDRLSIGNEEDGYTVIKILNDVKVLGVFNVDGIEINQSEGENIDSVLVSVTEEEAKQINLIREIANFNITGITEKQNAKNEKQMFNESGDVSGEKV